MKWTIGSDPELFLTENGQLVNAYNFLGERLNGTKEKPEETKYGGIQVDGMALELNTNPTTDRSEFNELIEAGLEDVTERFPEYDISHKSVEKFSEEFLVAQPEESVILGCDPDFNAFDNGRMFPAPPEKNLMRTAGGHIHIGWGSGLNVDTPQHRDMCIQAARQLDVIIGPWALTKASPEDRARQKMYGHPGCFRPKHYGLEYRTPSNFWIFDQDTREEIFDRCVVAMNLLAEGKVLNSHNHLGFCRNIHEDKVAFIQRTPGQMPQTTLEIFNRYYSHIHTAEATFQSEREKLNAAA